MSERDLPPGQCPLCEGCEFDADGACLTCRKVRMYSLAMKPGEPHGPPVPLTQAQAMAWLKEGK